MPASIFFLPNNHININRIATIGALLLASCGNVTQSEKTNEDPNAEAITTSPSITKGRATQNVSPIFECDVPGWRVTAVGQITGTDGQDWTVPADTVYASAPKATDLFNECTGVLMKNAEALDVNSVPIVELDADGEVITAYFFGDNYAEIYVNGKVIAVDPVPYWPFNTSAVRFKVERPFLAGIKMIDWSENLGLGSELMRGVPYHTGDGGFVAIFKDENGKVITTTDENWKVQPYYFAPLLDAACVKPDRTSKDREVPPKKNAEEAYGVHYSIPENWAQKGYDDTNWQTATLYTNEDIGGSLNRPAYQNFTGLFDDPKNDAEFIWSQNLLQDNVVLARRLIK